MAVKAVIFDLDGTLYDNSKLPAKLIWRSLLNLRWLRAERMARRSMAGKYIPSEIYSELFHNMAEITGGDCSSARKWFYDTYMPLQAAMLRKYFHPKPWVVPTLITLRQKGIRLACMSDYCAVEDKLKALGIDPQLFDVVTDAPSAGGMKPCREAFMEVARMLGVNPEDALVVGDRADTDGAGAANSGMQYLKVPVTDTETIDLNILENPN